MEHFSPTTHQIDTALPQNILTGYGLKSTDIPIRLPAIIAPSLELLKSNPENTLTVYQATEFIAETNDIPLEKALELSEKQESFLKRFITQLYPEQSHQILFQFRMSLSDQDRAEIEAIRSQILDIIDQTTEGILNRNAKKHSGSKRETHLTYAAANIFYNGASPQSPFYDQEKQTVLVGGQKELPFFDLSKTFAGKNNHFIQTKLLKHIGKVPVYYPAREDLLSIEDFKEYQEGRKKISKDIKKDVQILIQQGLTLDILSNLYPQS